MRPLSLKNSDAKAIGGALNFLMKDFCAENIIASQRGFVQKRQLTRNVVDMDAMARIYSMTSSKSNLPYLAFFDFAAAFPSVAHEWIYMSLKATGIPSSYINIIQALYNKNAALVYRWLFGQTS